MEPALQIGGEMHATLGRTLTGDDYERFMPMVRRIAMRMVRRLPRHVQVADLVSAGWVGLLEACARFDADMPGDELEAYASYRVRGAMLDHLRRMDPATRQARNTSRRIARVIRDLNQSLGRAAAEEEIAESLGLDLDGYREMLGSMAGAGMTRLEMVDFDEIDAARSAMPVDRFEAPDEAAEKRLLADAVAAAITTLPERLQQVVALYYQEGCTLREIGAVLDLTESRVCQLHAEAMHRLRAAIGTA
jgi:RNA polymerase sigma factor for flagellar operon FliA